MRTLIFLDMEIDFTSMLDDLVAVQVTLNSSRTKSVSFGDLATTAIYHAEEPPNRVSPHGSMQSMYRTNSTAQISIMKRNSLDSPVPDNLPFEPDLGSSDPSDNSDCSSESQEVDEDDLLNLMGDCSTEIDEDIEISDEPSEEQGISVPISQMRFDESLDTFQEIKTVQKIPATLPDGSDDDEPKSHTLPLELQPNNTLDIKQVKLLLNFRLQLESILTMPTITRLLQLPP